MFEAEFKREEQLIDDAIKNEKEIDNLLTETKSALEEKKKIEEEKKRFELNTTIRFSTIKLNNQRIGSTEMTEINNKKKEIEKRLYESKNKKEQLKSEIWEEPNQCFLIREEIP